MRLGWLSKFPGLSGALSCRNIKSNILSSRVGFLHCFLIHFCKNSSVSCSEMRFCGLISLKFKIFFPSEWKVRNSTPLTLQRSRSSSTVFLVKEIARISSGWMPRLLTRYSILASRLKVLPLPAEARTSCASSQATTASICCRSRSQPAAFIPRRLIRYRKIQLRNRRQKSARTFWCFMLILGRYFCMFLA